MLVVLLTGATDGIGFETAKSLVTNGHYVLVHGRSPAKIKELESELEKVPKSGGGKFESFRADLSKMSDVEALATAVAAKHSKIDILINNAGVYQITDPMTGEGLDARFAVNTLAPYLLTIRLLPLIPKNGRVVNLSSAAQAPVDLDCLAGRKKCSRDAAYAQSKLAITMWTNALAKQNKNGPVFVSVNPASFLGTKMVQEAYGMAGGDIKIGSDILVRAATAEEFSTASGKYFNNDARAFGSPHRDALDQKKCAELVAVHEEVLGL